MFKTQTAKILGFMYRIVFKKDPTTDDGIPCQGTCDPNNLTIELDPNYPAVIQREVMLHEVIEALNAHLEWELPHCVIQQLGVHLSQVIHDNKWIQERLIR